MQVKTNESVVSPGFRPYLRREYMFDVEAFERHYCPFCGRQLLPDQQTYCQDLGADDYMELLFYHQGLQLMWSKDYEQALSKFKLMRLKRAGALNFYKAICYFRIGNNWQMALCWSRAIRYKNTMALLVLFKALQIPDYLGMELKKALAENNFKLAWKKLAQFFLQRTHTHSIRIAVNWLKRCIIKGNKECYWELRHACRKDGVLNQEKLHDLKNATINWLHEYEMRTQKERAKRHINSILKFGNVQEEYKCQH